VRTEPLSILPLETGAAFPFPISCSTIPVFCCTQRAAD